MAPSSGGLPAFRLRHSSSCLLVGLKQLRYWRQRGVPEIVCPPGFFAFLLSLVPLEPCSPTFCFPLVLPFPDTPPTHTTMISLV